MTDKPIWDQLAELGAQIPPEEWAKIEAERSPGQLITDLRADRDSLRDALAAALAWWEEARNEARGSHATGMVGTEADDFARCGAVLGERRA